MRLEQTLSVLRSVCLDVGGAVSALHDYVTLGEQAAVLKELLPGHESRPELMRREPSGLRGMEDALLKKLGTLIPINEAMVDSFDGEDGSPLHDIPFQSWFPHGDETLGDYMEELPEAERLAAIISWGGTPEQVADAFGLDEVQRFAPPKYEEVIDRLERQREPIRYLADAFRVVNKDTSCFWWDVLCAAAHNPSHVTGAVM
ncbi:MAG: hypothetical protein U0166_00490 [Acidobacteriota bacterium]